MAEFGKTVLCKLIGSGFAKYSQKQKVSISIVNIRRETEGNSEFCSSDSENDSVERENKEIKPENS